MVLITEKQGKDLKIQENGVAGGGGLTDSEHRANEVATNTPTMSISDADEDGDECEVEVDYMQNYWEDDDDVYQEFEELDFEALPDRSETQSITSDDSFYPPENSVICCLYRSPSPDSPEPISFFKACCNNNAIIVKIMIRQGVTEEEVKETDRNGRVGIWVQYLFTRCYVLRLLCICFKLSEAKNFSMIFTSSTFLMKT